MCFMDENEKLLHLVAFTVPQVKILQSELWIAI